MILKLILSLLFLIGLWYILIPYPKEIVSTPPQSVVVEESDWVVTLYTNENRVSIENFYKSLLNDDQCKRNSLLCLFGPLNLNRRVEEVEIFYPSRTPSNYLFELYYPFKGSVVINGFEPLKDRSLPPTQRKAFIHNGNEYLSKIMIKYVSPSILLSLFLYILSWIGTVALIVLVKRVVNK